MRASHTPSLTHNSASATFKGDESDERDERDEELMVSE